MFPEVAGDASFPELEEEVLKFWKEQRIYERSLEQREGCPRFVFYEGPPTANGMPHPGHCLTRAIKDLFPRYRTMRGYFCERKAGWDTHGLPVEVEVCKELGIHSKEEIEEYGIEPFIQKCQQSVWRYMQEWERLTERLGFWIHLDEAYVTYHQSYVESVWWSLKSLFDRGLLYQGHKIVWWWAQGGTALSSGEVGQGYREVADPSVYIKFPLVDTPNTSLLVWTTTPWTLPSNQFAAVNPELEYATVEDAETKERLIVAAELTPMLAEKAKRDLVEVSRCRGKNLLGQRYVPPFDFYYAEQGDQQGTLQSGEKQHLAWRVVPAAFVSLDSGTGLVHQAPAFGEVDYEVLVEEQARFVEGEGPTMICAIGSDGRFTDEVPPYQGQWVKDADKQISRDLKAADRMWHQEQYLHDYPFCWRAQEDPLIQYPRKSWFIRTTQFKDRMLANNSQINWLPEHIRDGRFGNFLESNVDWALSRERFWGTPLPVWVCQETGRMEAMGSYEELLGKPGLQGLEVWEQAKQANPELPDDLRIHKPYIDEVTYESPYAAGARMKRVTEVIDCWYDSGAMPFAQWGYPHQNRESFEEQFPADFISEALDQTRGWFYSLLAISTMLFGEDGGDDEASAVDSPHEWPLPYRTCIVLGLMLGEDGRKMSKSLRNYREPGEVFDRYGADALRWFFFATQPPWTTIRYQEQAIKDCMPEFLLRLRNVLGFFVIYANIDGFDPAKLIDGQVDQLNALELSRHAGYRPVSERGEIDRWVMSELHRVSAEVVERMDQYDNYGASQLISGFVDGLSNWYVRLNRSRFWTGTLEDPAKADAYWTLYEVLLTTAKLIAPFTPFMADNMWRTLAGVFGDRVTPSVHLCDYPTGDERLVDPQLSERMALLREIASLGRSARMNAKLKVRQPLALVEIILASTTHQGWLEAHDSLLRQELNIEEIQYTTHAEEYISYRVLPNFKRLGARVKKLMPVVKRALQEADGGQLLHEMEANGKVTIDCDGTPVELTEEDVEVRLEAKEGWAAAQGSNCVVVLSTELTDELLRKGYSRDFVRFVQEQRKQMQCDYTDRINIGFATESVELKLALEENAEYIQAETLAVSLVPQTLEGVEPVAVTIADADLQLYVAVATEGTAS